MKFNEKPIEDYKNEKTKQYYEVVESIGKNAEIKEIKGVGESTYKYFKEILPKDLKGETVLDIGCGDGRWAEHLLKLLKS